MPMRIDILVGMTIGIELDMDVSLPRTPAAGTISKHARSRLKHIATDMVDWLATLSRDDSCKNVLDEIVHFRTIPDPGTEISRECGAQRLDCVRYRPAWFIAFFFRGHEIRLRR